MSLLHRHEFHMEFQLLSVPHVLGPGGAQELQGLLDAAEAGHLGGLEAQAALGQHLKERKLFLLKTLFKTYIHIYIFINIYLIRRFFIFEDLLSFS